MLNSTALLLTCPEVEKALRETHEAHMAVGKVKELIGMLPRRRVKVRGWRHAGGMAGIPPFHKGGMPAIPRVGVGSCSKKKQDGRDPNAVESSPYLGSPWTGKLAELESRRA